MISRIFNSITFKIKRIIDHIKSVSRWFELMKVSHKIGVIYSLDLLKYFSFDLGQYNSLKNSKPLDFEGNPLPWFTYSSIEFLKQLDLKNKIVFEFGSGMSSLWWSNHAKKVISVEDNQIWFSLIQSKMHQNNILCLETSMKSYSEKIRSFDNLFDIIVIDGNHRLECAKNAVDKLSKGGMIILDNSDWFGNTGFFLKNNGFKQMDFIGPGPINRYSWSTSIFFKGDFSFDSLNKFQPKNLSWGISDNLD